MAKIAGDGPGELVSETYITGFPTYPTQEGSAIMLVEAPCSESDPHLLPLTQNATINDTNETIQQNPDATTLAIDKAPTVVISLTRFNAADTLFPEWVCSKTSSSAEVQIFTAVLASIPLVMVITPYSRARRMEQTTAAVQASSVNSSSGTRMDRLFVAGWFLLRCAKKRYVMTTSDQKPCGDD